MPAELIDGKVVSEKVRNEVAAAVANLPGKPCLAVVLVGDDPASALYVKSKGEKTEAAGMRSITKRFPASATQAEVEAELTVLNGDPEVDGILLQLPLPKGLDEAKALEARKLAEEAMKTAKTDIDFAAAQGEFASMAAQIAAIRKFRRK